MIDLDLKTRRFMVDCETLDTAPTAALLQVAIVEFDISTMKIVAENFWRVDPNDCVRLGCTVSTDTLSFWVDQDIQVVRNAFHRKDAADATDYWNPLIFLVPKIMNAVGIDQAEKKEFWCCGTRDYEWLENAIIKVDALPPWQYRQWRDFRTLREMFNGIIKAPRANKHKHHALHDARHQAEHLMAIFKSLMALPTSNQVPEDDDL